MSAMGENSQVRTATRGEGLVKPRKPKTNTRRREETRPRGEEPNLLLEPNKAGHAGNREKLMITSGGGGGNGGGGKLLGKSEGDDFVPPPRHPEWVTSGHLLRRFMVEGGAGKNLEEAQGAARSGEPIVLAGSGIAKRELSRRWTFDYLMCSAGAPPGLEVLCSMDGKNRFTSVERENNAYGSYYFVREPETIALDDQTSLADFVECARGWRGKHVCATAVVMQRKGEVQARGGDDEDGGARVLTEAELAEIRARLVDPAVLPAPAPGLGATLARDLANLLAWDRLASFLKSQSLGSVGSVRLRLGTTNGLHPLRYDLSDRIVVQVRGRSRYLVVGPEFALRGLYPYPTHHPYDRYSMVDLEQDEAEIEEHWPLFRQNARGREVVLREGECLFLPRYQFAQRQDLDPETVSLEMEVAKGMRTRHENAVPLQVSRLLERRVAEVEGVRGCQHWLSVIAHEEEAEWVDAGTVKGHRRVKMVEAVREEVEQNLGTGKVRDFLMGCVDRRLVPTPWLNEKLFREPLYLLDRPYHVEDDRTDLEKKFPEFFRTKLRREGWEVPEAKSTVPIPGYNMPADADYRTYDPAKGG